MIDVNERWIIEVDELNYIPCKKSSACYDKKSGKEKYRHLRYYSNISDALCFIAEQDIRDGLRDCTETLSNAVERIIQVKNEYKDLIENKLKNTEE